MSDVCQSSIVVVLFFCRFQFYFEAAVLRCLVMFTFPVFTFPSVIICPTLTVFPLCPVTSVVCDGSLDSDFAFAFSD